MPGKCRERTGKNKSLIFFKKSVFLINFGCEFKRLGYLTVRFYMFPKFSGKACPGNRREIPGKCPGNAGKEREKINTDFFLKTRFF